MTDISVAEHIAVRLQADDCGGPLLGSLCEHYADQVLITGTKTTTEDALAAWMRWLASQGGRPEVKVSSLIGSFHERVAAVIREVARYQERENV
jgi:hypothetical protein